MPRQIRLRSLRTKIIAWSFVPATLVLFAVALVAFYAYQQVAQDLVVERNRELARLSAAQLADELAEYSARLVEWAQTAGSSAQGQLAQQAALQQASNQLAVFDGGVVVLDDEGMVVAAEPERPEILGQDWSNRVYFRQAALIRRPVFSDLVYDGPGRSPAIVVAVPLLGNEGELPGVVVGGFRLGATAISSLYGSIVKLHIGGNDMTYLVDGDGQVIYHGDPDMIGHDFSAESAVAQVLARNAGAFRTHNWAERDIVASFAPVPGTSWGLVIEADWDALLRGSQGYRPLLLGLLALGVILPAIVVAVGVRRITQPIGDLIGAAQQVASGNFGQTVTASTGDEIEELVTQFNWMSAQLAESYSTLQAREERLALVLQGTNDGIWDWNLDTDEVYYSPRWKSMLGYQEHEIEDHFEAWRSLIHPDDAERAMARVQAELAGAAPSYELEHRLRHKDGSYRWILTRGTALRDADGRAYRMVGSHTDITQRKRAEEELRRQNEYLAALHETTLGMISRLDIEELLEAIVERAVHLVGGTYGFLYLVRPETDEIEVSVGTGPYREFVGRRLNRGEGLSGIIWQLGQPLVVDDYHAWRDRSPQFEGVPFGPAMGTPLMSGAEVVGVIGVARPLSGSPFRQDEVDLITRFSHLASIALDNAHLHTSLQQELAERVRAEEALQARVEFEDAIARISSSFVNLAPEQVDEGIQRALQTIGKANNVERAYVFQFSGDRSGMDCTHEWCTDGIEPRIDRMKDEPISAWRWTAEQIMRFEVVQIQDGSELPPEASAERAELQSLGLRSRIVVPMVYLGTPVGFVGFDARRARHWTEQSLKLQVVGDIFVNALEHKRAQAIQAGQRQFLELLATGGEFVETLHSLVRLLEDQWPGMLGLILLLDHDGRHLHIGAAARLPDAYVQSIEGLEIGPMVGSCGTACYHGERVIVEDTATDPRWDGLRDLALQHGLRACWSEPVFSPGGSVVGTFAMYYRQPRAPTRVELRAIEMAAHLVGVAIEHKRAGEALRESEEKFRGIIEYANIGIAIVQDARFRFVNPHYAAMLGYTVEALLDTEFMRYCAPEERDRIVDLYTRRARGEPAPPRYETAMVHKNGGRVYAEVSAGIIPYGGQQATFVFLRDITEQKQAKRALEQAYQTLEQRVDERTRELSTLLEVSKNVVSRLELEPLLGSILDELRNVVEYEGCMVFALEADELVPLAHRGRTPQDQAMRIRLRADNPLDRLVLGGREPVIVSDTQGQSATARAYRRSVEEITETTFTHIRSWLGVPLVVKDQVIGALALDHSQPDHFSPAHARLVMAFANQAAVAIENARLFQAEQERREEAERRRHVAEGMREILALLNSRQSLQETLDFIASQTCRLLGSDAAAILRLKEGQLRIQAACGLEADYVAGVTMRLGEGGAGRALATRQPVIIADLAQAAQHTPQRDIPPGPQRSLIERLYREYRSILSVPLIVQGREYGAITAYYPGPREFSEEDLALAMSVADQVALAIENARLRDQAGQAAAMEERGRLARELHDSVTQSIYGVTMYTEAAARLMTAGQEATAAEYLRDARDTAQEALREMRLLIYQLRPPLLEKGGLPVALQVRLDAVERRGGIHAELIVEGQDQLPPPIQAELHQIAQEALNNALKHAHAQRVQVRLHFGEDETSLQVRDDGTGFEPAVAGKGGGLGITGMKERAHKIGGRLRIESAPGLGTNIVVRVPIGGGE